MTDPIVLQPGQSYTTQGTKLEVFRDGVSQLVDRIDPITITAASLSQSPNPLIMKLQTAINVTGYQPALVVDGLYGSNTDAAVRSFLPPPKPVRPFLGSSTPPSGAKPDDVEASTQVLEGQVGCALGAHRVYLTDLTATTGTNGPNALVSIVANDQSHGRATYASIKNNNGHTGWAEVAALSPAARAGMDVIVAGLAGTTLPVFLGFHHEPENDFGAGAKGNITQDQRDGYRFAADAFYTYLRPKLPPNVLIGSTYMQYTLTDQGAATWGHTSKWVGDHNDVIGFDDYFQDLDNVNAFTSGLGSPFMIGEFGKSVTAAGSEVAQARYLQWYLDWCDAHPGRCLAICWWNVIKMSPMAQKTMHDYIIAS